MPKGDKYKNLTEFLLNCNKDIITLSYDDLKGIIGSIPASVYKYSAAWSDRAGHSFSYGWLKAGYSCSADMIKQEVTFIRISDIPLSIDQINRTKRKPDIKETIVISSQDLDTASNFVMNDTVYGPEAVVLESIFKEYPTHNSIESTVIKLCVMDVTHSTQVFKQKRRVNIVKLAEVINSIPSIDKRLEQGDLQLVNTIARLTAVNFLSLASKYCALHNQIVYGKDDYYKYDSVLNNLINYKHRDYMGYHKMLDDIIFENNLEVIPNYRKKLDHFLWYKYKKKSNTRLLGG